MEPEGSPAAAAGDTLASSYRLIALIIASGLFMENLDATVLATAIPTMANDFHVRAPQMSVALTAYLLALALFVPASGHAADRWGAKNVFRAAIGVFTLGSLACAMAPTLPVMVVARFAQGIGGAMMVPVGRLVLLRTVSKRDLLAAYSWMLMPGLAGQISGPPIGGFIVTYLHWRWIFRINLPIGVAGVLLVGRFIPDFREAALRPFDLRGFVLAGIALSAALFGFETWGHGAPARVAGPLLATALIFGLLYVWHARRAAHPVLDLSLLAIPTFRLSFIGGSLTRITQGAQPFLLPLMMQLAFGLNAAKSGLITLGTALGTVAMKGFVGTILRRFGFRDSLTLMGVLAACSYALCGLFRAGWPFPLIFAVLIVSGFLMSFQFTAYNTIAFDEIPDDRMSSANAFYSTFQQLTLSFGICTAAATLHVSTELTRHSVPGFVDFSAAFWVVTAISVCSYFANSRFGRHAGRQISGAA